MVIRQFLLPLSYRSTMFATVAVLTRTALAASWGTPPAPACPIKRAIIPCVAVSPDSSIRLEARRFRLWDSTGHWIALIAYRIALGNPVEPDSGSGRSALVTFGLSQWDTTARERHDSTWTARLHRPLHTLGNFDVGGIAVAAWSPDLTAWSFSVVQAGIRRPGRAVAAADRPLTGNGIAVSDLVLGSVDNGVAWQHGAERILVGLSSVFDRDQLIQIHYQVRSDLAHDDISTDVTCTNITDPSHGVRVMALSFPGRLLAGINEAERALDVSRLKKGRYQIELQVADRHGGGSSVRLTAFTLQ